MDFVAIDVETANPDMASVYQVGIAGFRDGHIVSEWKSLVNPEDWFSPANVHVHGITEDMVADAPTLPEFEPALRERLDGGIVVCHTPFDRVSLHQAFEAYGLDEPTAVWLDSARVARRGKVAPDSRSDQVVSEHFHAGDPILQRRCLSPTVGVGAVDLRWYVRSEGLTSTPCPTGATLCASPDRRRAQQDLDGRMPKSAHLEARNDGSEPEG